MSSPTMFALDLRDRLVISVGGGAVGTRRVQDLLTRGARVRVISPVLSEALTADVEAQRIEWWSRAYAGPADLSGAWLVHVATGHDSIDAAVAADAQTHRIWCINSSSASCGSARTPARARLDTRDGPVEVAVSTGRDPRRAAGLRDAVV
ncbi:MAG: NAD(P)-dependent oxidoreductase, partial [Ornithinimicrobium sp.]